MLLKNITLVLFLFLLVGCSPTGDSNGSGPGDSSPGSGNAKLEVIIDHPAEQTPATISIEPIGTACQTDAALCAEFNLDSQVTIKATLIDDQYVVSHWSLADCEKQLNCSLLLNQDQKVTLYLSKKLADRDNDGVPDGSDIFPEDPNESSDLDKDGVGDNADTDRDGDGYSNQDEINHGGNANDKDVTPADLDKDFIPNAIDPDRDGDGINNDYEDQLGTDPNDASQVPFDLDKDGLPDLLDNDRDGDGVVNDEDVFPDNSKEIADLDGDGEGDNSDDDIDGDGFSNNVEQQVNTNPRDADDVPADLDGDKMPDQLDDDRDGDGVDNDQDDFPDDASKFLLVANLFIDTPVSGFTTANKQVVVTGTIDGPINSIRIEDQEAVIDGNSFTATIELDEGANKVTAVGTYQTVSGLRAANATKNIVLDTTAPDIIVSSVVDGMVTTSADITIAGSLDDLRSNLSANQKPVVTVNGIVVDVIDRSFELADYSLRPGLNILNIQATDALGNSRVVQRKIIYLKQAGQKILELGGNNQLSQVGHELLESLSVKLVDRNNLPIANRAATFKVSDGDGILKYGNRAARSLTLLSNDQGIIQANYQLGKRSGAGNHQVTVTAIGFPGQVIFSASAQPLQPAQLSSTRGNYQTGMMGSLLPEPFIARVTDNNGNPLAGVDVLFTVKEGGGYFINSADENVTEISASSDFDGNAIQGLVLGSTLEGLGFNSQVVQASVVGMPELATSFIVHNLRAGAINKTKISGLVLDNSNQPLPDVEVKITGNSFNTREAITDAQGMFIFEQAPVGTVHLVLDGSTTSRDGEWPHLMFELVTVSGQENTVGMPIYFPKVDYDGGKLAGGEQEIIIPMRDVAGAEVIIPANSMTFPDGRKTGRVMFTQVQTDKVPMPAPNGSVFNLAWTLQPAGIHFDPPARISLPNTFGGVAGEELEMFSFDHDLMEWVTIGPGVVSDDGAKITSRIGHGVRHSGWGGAPPPPEKKCNIQCNNDNECYDVKKSTKPCQCTSKFLKNEVKSEQSEGNCQKEYCGGPREDNNDKPEDKVGDCSKPTCESGSPSSEEDLTDDPVDGSDSDNPNDCVNEVCVGPPEPDDGETPDAECMKCQGGSPVEDKSHTAKSEEYQDPADCKLLFCDGTADAKDETANLPENASGDCQKNACAGMEIELVEDLDDTEPDSDFEDCKVPACNDEGFESAPEQHKADEKEECKTTSFRCDALSNTSIIDEEEFKPDGTPTESDKCKICDGAGNAEDISVGEASETTISRSLPAGIATAVSRLASKFGVSPDISGSGYSLKGTKKDCCSAEQGVVEEGIVSASIAVNIKPKDVDVLLWPKGLPRLKLNPSGNILGQYVEALVEGEVGLFLVGDLGFQGSIGVENDACKGQTLCTKASVGVSGNVGLEPRVNVSACISASGWINFEECGEGRVAGTAKGGFQGQVAYDECGAGLTGNVCSTGVTLTAQFIVNVVHNGTKYELKEDLAVPGGPYLKTCP